MILFDNLIFIDAFIYFYAFWLIVRIPTKIVYIFNIVIRIAVSYI